MRLQSIAVITSTILILVASAFAAAGPTLAQGRDRDRDGDRGDELARLHRRCTDGDRRACVYFGFIIGEARDRRDQWRTSNPDWFWWEEGMFRR
jgi:hypothetical protein